MRPSDLLGILFLVVGAGSGAFATIVDDKTPRAHGVSTPLGNGPEIKDVPAHISKRDINKDVTNDTDHEMEPSPMSMSAHHGRPVLEIPHLEPQQRKYWEKYNATTFFNAEQGNKVFLYLHASLMVFSWVMLYPTAVLMSTDTRAQSLYVPLQSAQAICVALSILFLVLYMPTAPDLYPGAIYPKASIIMLFLTAMHWTAMIVKSITQQHRENNLYERASSIAPEPHQIEHQTLPDRERQETPINDDESSNSGTLHSRDSFDIDAESLIGTDASHSAQVKVPRIVLRLTRSPLIIRVANASHSFSILVFSVLNFPLLVLGIQYMLLGCATGFCLGHGHKLYALLAHFIKGSVFFMLGFFELARYFGAFARYGMAWNAQPIQSSQSSKEPRISNGNRHTWTRYLKFWPTHPTMEFWQSFLIFFYGSTNVFLEHLGNNDGKWSPKDLQHVSIAFMFFGGGLCGLVLESTTVRRTMCLAFGTSYSPPTVLTFSPNPMPAFVIFWTGALMSHHQQETKLSTAIHIQWGLLFCIAAILRILTFAIFFIRGMPTDGIPQRPLTEVLVSCCLVCGGIIFMSSNRETVEAEIYRGFDQMFTLNVSVGVTMLLIALFSLALSLRGWASSHGHL